MSWAGLKKNLNRAATSVKSRTGHMDRSMDREFEEEEKRAKVLESKAELLHKQANSYAKAMREMTGAQVRLSNILEQFYDEGEPIGASGERYKDAVTKLEQQVQNEDAAFRSTVLEPIGRYYSYFPEISEAIRRRNKALLDYDNARSKVRKLVERPSEDTTKLPRAEHDANICRDVYESMNAQLTAELPKVIEARVSYLDPSLEAVVKSQLSYAQDALNTFEGLRQYFPPEPQDHEIEQQTEGILQQMRDLTICGLA
ncbi:hypothetical protein BGZ80_010529 [Entomortierella chlamydospora]|uniref:BAR domain-containing protein n=1 Tax=Entomortierella chlamydospora TaxID=101097 RepID=A0A9P6SZP4_9FUNG|nr:hypothetical protein BGZ79_008879 [Entomortierella chlamydospora]KAG0014299.1 hypothetical protein BGZ80_010529 [Entomortierella chlamydospora]